MARVTISGEIQRIDTEKVGAKQVPKTLVVVDEGGKYPSPIGIEFFGEDQSAWAESNCEQGGMLEIDCYIRGRDWADQRKGVTRNFISLVAVKQEIDEADRDQTPT